jgi:transcriptional regulator with XRE-family HTH domain
MRRAGLDIDGQLGGGRATLADKVGVSRSTVTRWLGGQTLPAPDQFAPLAEALGVYVLDILVDGGIVPPERAAPSGSRPPRPYDSGTELPADLDLAKLAELLGYLPEEQDIFVAVVETTMAALRERRIRAVAPPFEVTVAESDSYRQTGASPTVRIDPPTTE